MSQRSSRNPPTAPRVMPTTVPGGGPAFRPSYVVGMARIWVWRLAILSTVAGRGAEAGACRVEKWEAMFVIARRAMEGLLEWSVDERDSEIERETLRMISPEGVRGSAMGGMMRCVECLCSG